MADPRSSVAHGCNKYRHPFPVPLKVYDGTINVLKTVVRKARLGQFEKPAAIKGLDARPLQAPMSMIFARSYPALQSAPSMHV
jgi:hypothetical protein